MFSKLKQKVKTFKYGELIFTFPNGKRLYIIKDKALQNLSAKEYRILQENHNYLAYLGITKTNLTAMLKNLDSNSNDSLKVKEIVKVAERSYGEFDRATELMILNTFDMFFFFEDEDIFVKSDEILERKRYYLNEYPFFNNFFFQLVKKKFPNLTDTWNMSIQFALAVTTLNVIVKELAEEFRQNNLKQTQTQ